MAQMYPEYGHKETQSRAEPDLYQRFKTQLPDTFTVIHSLPWLAEAAKEVDGRDVPTGEIDFLVIHEELGILAVEVKGGIFSFDKTEFVYRRTGARIDPINQVRRGSHALAKWLSNSRIGRWKIGYCVFFPHSEMENKPLPPALIDRSNLKAQNIVLDIKSLRNIKEEIVRIMSYWNKALGLQGKRIRKQEIQNLVEILLPSSDYTPSWETIIENDTVTWLSLTPDQSIILKKIQQENRFVITGYPGTGKTLLLIEYARRLSNNNQRVLILTYNVMLHEYLRKELPEKNIDIYTFHEQCRKAARANDCAVEDNKIWYEEIANNQLLQALEKNKLLEYDVLLIDEGQAIKTDWWLTLVRWFENKKIIVACDPTQSFTFESSTSPENISTLIRSTKPYRLTINLRSPREVFDRIQEIKNSEYQQSSFRVDQNRLEEIITDIPRYELDRIIDNLEQEKIPSELIKIIVTWSPTSNLYRSIKVVSSRKFRGLESPVIIIMTSNTDFEETSLFCAYTRSTSRCIVIYDALGIATNSYGDFSEKMMDFMDEQTLFSLAESQQKRQEINSRKKQEARLIKNLIFKDYNDLLKISIKKVDLYWSNNWQSWIIKPDEDDFLERYIWISHLMNTTPYPVISWDVNAINQCKHYESKKTLMGKFKFRYYDFDACPSCNKLSPFQTQHERKNLCQCTNNNSTLDSQANSFIQKQLYLESLLSLDFQDTHIEKENAISIFFLCLWRIERMSVIDKRRIKAIYAPQNKRVRKKRSLAYNAALLMVIIDIIKTKNDQLNVDILVEFHLSLCPPLRNKEIKHQWKNFVSMALAYWSKEDILC